MVCYLCGKSNLSVIRRRLRYGIRRDVLQCLDCGLIFLQPKKQNLKDYYAKGKYRKRHSPVIGKKLSPREIFDIYLPYQEDRLKHIQHLLKPDMRALEVGCSAGHSLFVLKKYVDECMGIEFNKDEAEFVNKVIKVKTYTEAIEKTDIPLGYFDLICSFVVLEHIEDPLNFLKTIKEYLKPKGYLYLELPNAWDALISLYKVEAYCEFMFLEPHLFYFSPKTLSLLLRKAGFTGKIFSTQSYNFLNHMNWIFAGRSQPSASMGMSDPVLLYEYDRKYKKASDEINKFIRDVDERYKEILQRHFIAENLNFIGRKDSKKDE